jgi:hypothetical protein
MRDHFILHIDSGAMDHNTLLSFFLLLCNERKYTRAQRHKVMEYKRNPLPICPALHSLLPLSLIILLALDSLTATLRMSVQHKAPPLMPFAEVITAFILAIKHPPAVRMSAREEGAVMFLHMALVLSRTTKGASAPTRTLTRSSPSDVLVVVVHWRGHKCDRGLRMDIILRSEGHVGGLRVYNVNSALIYTMEAIDVGNLSIVTQKVVSLTVQHGSGVFY